MLHSPHPTLGSGSNHGLFLFPGEDARDRIGNRICQCDDSGGKNTLGNAYATLAGRNYLRRPNDGYGDRIGRVQRERDIQSFISRKDERQVIQRCLRENELKLISAYEPQMQIEALSSILSTPKAWLVKGCELQRVEITTERVMPAKCGQMGIIEVDIRAAEEGVKLW